MGGMAHWWGTQPDTPTCHAIAGATPSRIAGVLPDPQDITLIHRFELEKTRSIRLSLAYQFTDMRQAAFYNSSTFSTEETTLDAYNLVNFFVNHQLTENLEINASLVNVFDEEYTEIFGYSTKGRNYTLGLALTF